MKGVSKDNSFMGRSETVQCPFCSGVFAVGERESSVHSFSSFHALEYPSPFQAALKLWNKTWPSPASVQHWELPGINCARLLSPEGCLHSINCHNASSVG